ncbi:MAG: glycosyltransferase family 1 protein [Micrococcales bacterium]|nr:glycosyltransferase family 1 protein [Micrococcales bacterium]
MSKGLNVVIFGPPLDRSGGVGTLFTYFRNEVGDDVNLRFVDTRGKYRFPIFSFINLFWALVVATFLKFSKRIELAHLNMGSRGSTYRKLLLLLWLKIVLRTPTVLHLHASGFDTWIEGVSRLKKSVIISLINKADRLLVLGKIWKQKMVELGVNSDAVTVLVMGVPNLSEAQKIRKQSSGPIEVLFAGEMSERKGLPYLLNAMSDDRLFNFHLTVAGSGSTADWQTYIHNKPSSQRVTFLGLTPVADIHERLRTTDIFILPSRAEGLPVSVMEAFSSRTAVICSSVGALGEYLNDGVNSYVVEPKNTDSIAFSLYELRSEAARDRLSKSGHDTWLSSFNSRDTSARLIEIWRATITQHE